MCDEDKLKIYAKVLETEAIREKVKKNHEVKLQGLFKTKEALNSDAIPYQLCHLCPPNKNPSPA
jgi:hypothetical protein